MNQISCSRHRFSGSIIEHAAWLTFRFPLAFRDGEDMPAGRGADVSYESVRRLTGEVRVMFLRLKNSHLPLAQAHDNIVARGVSRLPGAMCFIHQQEMVSNPHRITDQMSQKLAVLDRA